MTESTSVAKPRRRGLRILAWVTGGIAAFLVLVLILIAAFGIFTIRRSFPQVNGTLEVDGITGTVDIIRDYRGIPTIYADTTEDLIYAQGYAHAQDRFWEMDVRRHITSGRLSEMFGKSQVPTDSFLRTLGWRRVAEQEVGLLSERSQKLLSAYAAGVNAYLKDRAKADISLEYTVLGLQNPGYVIEPWTPVDSVSWLKALAWDLRGNMSDEIYRAIMSRSAGRANTEALYPPYPFDRHRPIVEGGAIVDGRYVPAEGTSPTAQSASYVPDEAVPALESVLAATATVQPWLESTNRGIGSNSWAVSGQYTESGKPLLMNDPHLGPAMPSLWYQASLRCRTVSPACDYDVSGWTMAGIPGVFIGHNARVAWGFTNTGPDVTDLVLTKVKGDSYEYDGTLIPLTTRTEVIKVAGGDPVTITVRSTDAGPILSDVAEAGDTFKDVGGDYAVALRWTALTPSRTFDGFDAINTASNFDDFRAAARYLAVPAQNLLYADVDGTIAYQMPGQIPIRKGYDGKWPVPGWSSDYGWTGYIPFEELPYVKNPKDGWIVTANQAVIGPDYPNFITDDWSYGSRSQRIVDLIKTQIAEGRPFTVTDMQKMQMDSWSENAAFIVPRIADAQVDGVAREALDMMGDWDFQQWRDSAAAAYFNAFWRQLITRMVDDESGTSVISASGDDQFFEVIRTIWDRPDDFWWDDKSTPEIETRDQTIRTSLLAAADEMVGLQGGDPGDWTWGAMHTLLLQNQTLGDSGIKPIEWLFNRGPIETAGGSGIVNATGWTPSEGYEVTWVPSMRMVVDLADFDRSTWVNLTGNSGHAFAASYADQVQAWQEGRQYPWPWSPNAVQNAEVDRLTLK